MTTAQDGTEPGVIDAQATRRGFLGLCAIAGITVGLGAQATGTVRKTTDRPWRLLVNEAVTGESNLFVLTQRYQPLAEYVEGIVRPRPAIGIEPVVDIQRFLTVAQSLKKPELVFGKSVNQLAKLVRDNGYQPLVRRADPYKAAFIIAKGSPIRTFADIAKTHAKIIMPDESAATSAVAKAELRRQNAGDVQIIHTRYQEAVAQQVFNGFAQVGVVNPTIARKWAAEGGHVLAETQPVVNWSVLASPALPEAEVSQLRAALLAMNAQAPDVLTALGIKQWAAAERQDYLALLDYTKE